MFPQTFSVQVSKNGNKNGSRKIRKNKNLTSSQMIGSRGFGINEMIIIAIDKTMINCASMVK